MAASALPVEMETKRKPNFTDTEKLFLLHQYELYKPILSSRLCDGMTNRQKHEVWLKITAEVNARNPHVERTTKDVKKKWENLATQARKEMLEYRQNIGKSIMVNPPSMITLKVLQLVGDIPSPTEEGSSMFNADYAISTEDVLGDENGQFQQEEEEDEDDEEIKIENENYVQPAIEIDASNEISPDDSSIRIENGYELIPTMVNFRARVEPSELQFSPPQTSNSTSISRETKRRRSGDDEGEKRSSKPRNETKRLKRLKLQLETEKLVLEKKKLELEILVLKNQLGMESM